MVMLEQNGKNWKNKNINLALLVKHLGDFFIKEDFEAIKGEIPNGYQIFAHDSSYYKLNGYVNVTIIGKPSDFTVKLEFCREGKGHFFGPILLSTMFIGGYFLKRKLKSEEDWMKLEKKFWKYLDNIILHLNNSADNQ